MSNTYTEDEFKNVLKSLFAEKKRVKELLKKLEERGIQHKFQAKLSHFHKHSFEEEFEELKNAYSEKERLNEHLKGQLEKVRPALKKLICDLKAARAELEKYQQQGITEDESQKLALEEALKQTESLKGQIQTLETEKERLVKEGGDSVAAEKQILDLEKEKQELGAKIEALGESLKAAQINEQKESARFESEKSRLVERLAESLSQVQRQTEVIKEMRSELSFISGKAEEAERYSKELEELKKEKAVLDQHVSKISDEMEHERHSFFTQAKEWETKEEHYTQIQAELEEAKAQLQASDLAAVREEYESKLNASEQRAQKAIDELCASHEEQMAQLNTEIANARAQRDTLNVELTAQQETVSRTLTQKETAHQEELEKYYKKMRELSDRHAQMVQEQERLSYSEKEKLGLQSALQNLKLKCEEKDAEILKAQKHLAKKVKESTILHDLVEQQKEQLVELQKKLDQHAHQLEQMQNSLNLQKMHEEKLQSMAKERAQAAETLAKEWQDKFLGLQDDWQEQKGQLIELQKMRKTYDQMATTVSSLKNILGKNALESQSEETIEESHLRN